MFPWLFWIHWSPHWAPQLHFPLSGAVTQDIVPVQAGAGDAGVEREVGELASYGRQLGWLSELLLGQQADATAEQQAAAADALRELRALSVEVADIKRRHRDARLRAATRSLEELARDEPEVLAALLARLPAAPEPKRLPAPAKRRAT